MRAIAGTLAVGVPTEKFNNLTKEGSTYGFQAAS